MTHSGQHDAKYMLMIEAIRLEGSKAADFRRTICFHEKENVVALSTLVTSSIQNEIRRRG
jgi:hypothetical protein